MNKVFDEKKISTFKSLKDLATGNKLVGRREIIIGIDERAIEELRNYIFKADMFDEYLTAKCDSYEKYWKQANRDIQAYEKELREYVASLLYDNDYKSQELKKLTAKDKEIERLNKGCKELENQVDDLYKLETTLTNENQRLNNIINEYEKIMKECSDRILKELNENNHLSYRPALSINYKLTNYKELKESK